MSEGVDQELSRAWRHFLDAVESADLERLRASLSKGVTMYLPLADPIDALRGPDAVVARFARAFARDRASVPAGRRIEFSILEFQTRLLGPDVALCESLVAYGTDVGRRSVVYAREEGRWRILHLHGSNLARPQSRLPWSLG